MKKGYIFFAVLNITSFSILFAQKNDTTKAVNLSEVIINEHQALAEMEFMPAIKDNVIYAGKKTAVIQLDKINADLSSNNTRQVFAKVPGISIWENDGSGIQLGIASRGLSPNRSWEFNVRQNGYDISSEVFGYPENYYTPPMEAMRKIEVIRGSASLQYGPQFGGVLNYQIKKGNPNKPISFEAQQTLGSYGLFNTYMAIGGTHEKFSYYGFIHHRAAEGWRNNSRYSIYTGYFSANYQLTKKINIEGEYTNMNYKSQQPGGLSDEQYTNNHRQSFRERNWFGAPFNVASLTIKYNISQSVNLQIKSFATIAERNSVGFTKSITLKDSVNPKTLEYNARQVDRDNYKNYGTELRSSVKYKFFGNENIFAGGIRLYRGSTIRNQLGIGTTGIDFDLSLINPKYERSLEFETTNYAAFAENIFQIGNRLKIVPGIRFDYIENKTDGYINTSQLGMLNSNKRVRQLLLYGIRSEFKITEKINLYGNYSLAYRPVTFSELTPSATTEIIDQNLKDATGFNADFGFKGTVKNYLNFDVGLFYLFYDNRIGTLSQNGGTLKTNIGTSVSKGLESYVEIDVVKILTEKSKIGSISIFASNSFIDANYVKWNNPSLNLDPTKSIEDKRLENAPQYINRFGATYYLKGFSATFQLNSIGDVFTDAANTEIPNASGTIGKLSGYEIMDASLSYRFMERYNLKAGVNNITDEKYATRRAGGYPGPGIMPGNGRTIFVSIGASF
ncbi:MAG: TonB-dependent receptor [Sphingobacteriia bacterium]|nr:TonB-dependent receptor [Candidatus Fonsibacter lacus]